MSYSKTEVGLLINTREPDDLPQHYNRDFVTASKHHNNNDGEKILNAGDAAAASGRVKMFAHDPSQNTNFIHDCGTEKTEPSAHAINGCDKVLYGGGSESHSAARKEPLPRDYLEDEKGKNLSRKYKLSIKNETVIVSRIDGVVDSTGEWSLLYKCHLCGKLGGTLDKLRKHLAAHSHRLPFRCSLCDVRFQLKPQLSFHMKTQHRSFSPRNLELSDIGDVTELEGCHEDPCLEGQFQPKSEDDVPGVSGAKLDAGLDGSYSLVDDPTLLQPPVKVVVYDSEIMKSKSDVIATESLHMAESRIKHSFQELMTSQSQNICANNQTACSQNVPKSLSNQTNHTNGLVDSSSPFTCRQNKDYVTKNAPAAIDPAKHLDIIAPFEENQGMDMTYRSRSHGHSDLNNPDCPGQKSLEPCLGPELVAVDLASRIRETEHLSDDITVVIPSDAPIDGSEQKSNCLKTSVDSETTCQNKIFHVPPHKSILGNSQLRTKRKLSVSSYPLTSSSSDSLPKAIHGSGGKHMPEELSGRQMPVAPPGASIGSLPLSVYNPLALSNFVQGFNGLMSSPLLSPIITQTPLGFPGMLINPLSLYAAQLSSGSIASLMNSKVGGLSAAAATSSMDCGQRDPAPPGIGQAESLHIDSLSDSGGRLKEELSNGGGSSCLSSTSEGYASPNSKCSSLSRTHSRLNVIQKPIKRENAYKPIIMSDGRTAYHCLYCNKNFCTISDVNRHMDFHEDIRPYKCRFCSYYARTNSQLKVHMMRHQGIRDFLCRLCNYKGVTQSDLNRHTKSQIHMMKERNVCTLCREGFVSPMNLEQHRIEKHLKVEACSDSSVKYHLTMAGLVKENGGN